MDAVTEEYGLDLERQKHKVMLILNGNRLCKLPSAFLAVYISPLIFYYVLRL